MTENFQREAPAQDDRARVHRLCRHKYAGTLHLTNLWWSDSDDDVLGTDALAERQWLDHLGRARLHVDLGAHPLHLQVLSADARECLLPLTTYLLSEANGQALFVRQIAEEVARENEAMAAATRGMAFADAWLAVLQAVDLKAAWQAEMASRGYAGDRALEAPFQSDMPARLIHQARRNWFAAYDGAKARCASLVAEWDALSEEEARIASAQP
jgi:hypothetical protein